MIAWAIETVVATTLLMLLVLAIRNPVRRSFGPGVAYALWSLPVLRMLLPPLPEEVRGGAQPMLSIVPEDIVISLGHPVATLPLEPAEGLGWPVWAAMLWLVGVIGFLAYHLIAHSRFCARLRSRARVVTSVASGRVTMIESDTASGPLAFGIWHKYVAFPADFAERYDDLERDLALAHELGHHARGDLLANWIALVMLSLHWFNPVAWRAFRAFRADQEMACDALVLSGRHPALRHAYGRAIVKSAHGGAVSAACHLHTINEIKGRLRMLTRHQKPTRAQRMGGLAGIGALTLAGLAVTASGTEAAENLKASVAERTGVDIDRIELPELPLPPAPVVQVAVPAPPAPLAAIEPPAAPAAKEKRRVHVYTVKDGDRVIHWSEGDPIDPADKEKIDAAIARAEEGRERAREARAQAREARERGQEARRAAREAMANAPEVRSMNCEGDGPFQEVTTVDGKKRIKICTNRIERHTATAMASADLGRMHARSSIKMARRAIERDQNLSDSARAEALAGLDKALAEMNAEHGDH